MYLGITSLTDEELQSRRSDLDQVFQMVKEELGLLNRENDRRGWAAHAALQAEVAKLESRNIPPDAPAFAPIESASTSEPAEGVVVATGPGVTVRAG